LETVFITGGNSGLGFETAKVFLLKGYKVIVTCRDENKAQETISKLKVVSKHIEAIVIELNDLKKVREAIDQLTTPIDILICNAGMAYSKLPIHYSKNGIEETFAVNYLSHFYITTLLLAKGNRIKKILVVSSNLHAPELSKGFSVAPEMNDLTLLAFPETHGRITDQKRLAVFYPNSKLCNVLFGYEINRRYSDIVCNIISPGFMPGTGLPRYSSALMRGVLKYIFPLFGKFMSIRTPEQSAKDVFHIVNTADAGGNYYDGREVIHSSKLSHDEVLAKKLWTYSEQMINQFVKL